MPARLTMPPPRRFVVDTVPLLDITGTVTPDSSAFLLAAAGLRLDDGRIVIADMYDAAVRYFDASGRLIRKVGRRGAGPGEFENLTANSTSCCTG